MTDGRKKRRGKYRRRFITNSRNPSPRHALKLRGGGSGRNYESKFADGLMEDLLHSFDLLRMSTSPLP